MPTSHAGPSIVVYGASGHTGRFVVAELIEKGFTAVLAGRDERKLAEVRAVHGGLEVRTAALDDPGALAAALAGAAAVIHAAGPFAITATPIIEAAIRAGIPYLDIAAEPDIVAATIERHADQAQTAGVVLAPAVGFYGGLGDLLATAAMGDWPQADEITLAYALSSWVPTPGTRATIETAGERRGGQRLVFANDRLELRNDEAATAEWQFPEPFGNQIVVGEFTTADCVTISRHLSTGRLHEYMTLAPLRDLADPHRSRPEAVDARGRSDQTFLLQAVVVQNDVRRRAVVRGQDIYAVTAPLVVEATRRIIEEPRRWRGVVSAGQLGDARTFLEALAPEHLTLEIS